MSKYILRVIENIKRGLWLRVIDKKPRQGVLKYNSDESIIVEWRDGTTETITDLERMGQLHVLGQANKITTEDLDD
jgi:hypothetical protein